MSERADILDFIENSPTPAHFIAVARKQLLDSGFAELVEEDDWNTIPDKFFVVRDERCIIAIHKTDTEGGLIIGSHSDSPVLKCKPNSFSSGCGTETVSVANYGGGMWYSWVDRDLSIAGRAIISVNGRTERRLFASVKPVGIIPSPSINFDKKNGLSPSFDLQENFNPIVSLYPQPEPGTNLPSKSPTITRIIADLCHVDPSSVVDAEVTFFPHQKPQVGGFDGSLLRSARIDNLSSVFSSLKAIIKSKKPKKGLLAFVVYDDEEHGSNTRCGSKSNFTKSVLSRIGCQKRFYAKSLFISADVCHAYHPNYPEESEDAHKTIMGKGPAYAWHPNMNFATDKDSLIELIEVAKNANIPIQAFATRNDQRTGSTIGPHISSSLGIKTVDIGIPMLGMHSTRETGSFKDIEYLGSLFDALYEHHSDFL